VEHTASIFSPDDAVSMFHNLEDHHRHVHLHENLTYLIKYYYGDQIKKYEMGETCITRKKNEKKCKKI